MATQSLSAANPQYARAYRLLLGFAFGAAPRESALFLVCGVVMALYEAVLSFGAKLLVDAALARDLSGAIGAAILMAAFMGVSLLNTLYYLDFLFAVAEKAGAAVNRRLMTLLADVPGLAHHEQPAYLRELDLLREDRGRLAWMTNATAGIVRVAVGLGASLVLLVRLDPLLLLLPLLGLISFWTGRRAQVLWNEATEATAEPERQRQHLFDLATTAAAGKEVRVFDLVAGLIRRHHAVAESVIQVRDRATWQKAGLEAAGTIGFGLGYVGAVALVLLRAVRGELTPGDVVMTIGLAAGLNGVVSIAVGYGTSFLYVLRAAQRYLWLEDYAASTRVSPVDPLPAPGRLRTGIAIKNLVFRYPGLVQPVLNDVSLVLPAGSVVALVGENGAGKTTLVKLLARFYEPDQGEILVDGVDLRRFPVNDWRARLSTAFQDFSRFEFRVRETVGVGQIERIDDSAAVHAALVGAGAADVAVALPGGIETQLGRSWEHGVELSGGQWQKLSLARAMMRPRPLLVVFDEPTAALDAPTEHALFERVAAAARSGETAGTVTLLVTHRFSTVRMADLIVVLNGGRIAEVGSHRELVNANGLYAELYELQARTYR
jgi:ATP-binding cassette subfamily B protein